MIRSYSGASVACTTAAGITSTPAPPGKEPRGRSSSTPRRPPATHFKSHHDHLGLAAQRNAEGDNIYNGAVDNASGAAALLAIARACSSLPKRPARSILFAAVAAEEQGLLGSLYLAEHPPIAAGNLA